MEVALKQHDGECEIEVEEEKQKYVPCTIKPKFLKDVSNKQKKAERQMQKTKKMIETQKKQAALESTKKSMKFIGQSRSQKASRKVLYFNGNKIEGIWIENKLHGYTTIQYQTGQYFQGYYENGVKVSGMIKFRDGTQYSGTFSQNLFHGYGALKDPSNRVITCKWDFGKPEQRVKIQYQSGDIYYGEIKNLQKHGSGHLFFKNGNKYIGDFQNGKITGYGCFYENDIKIAEGLWKNGTLQDQKQQQTRPKPTLKFTKSYTNKVQFSQIDKDNDDSKSRQHQFSQVSISKLQ